MLVGGVALLVIPDFTSDRKLWPLVAEIPLPSDTDFLSRIFARKFWITSGSSSSPERSGNCIRAVVLLFLVLHCHLPLISVAGTSLAPDKIFTKNRGREMQAVLAPNWMTPHEDHLADAPLVLGRGDEMRRWMQIHSRRTTSTSSLIGAPGVGNPAISDHLAQRIVQGAIPQALLPCGLISLDMVAVNAGPKFPGELEDRLHSVLTEVTDSDGHLLLFIDEIHPVVGAGATNGAMDAGNNMQPILGRGELRCIGVTTLHAYRKYIVKDPSLAHRFQQVYLDQPCVEDTISIHRGLRERYELHHGIRIDDSALVKAAIKSDRYIRGPFFSIDLVDVAATKLTMEITAKPIVLAEIDRTVLQWDMGGVLYDHHMFDVWLQSFLAAATIKPEDIRSHFTPPSSGSWSSESVMEYARRRMHSF